MRTKTVYSSEIFSTMSCSFSGPTMSTRSPTSYGCLTNRKMQDPKNSWVVTAKTNDSDRRAVPAVASVVMKLLWKKATVDSH